MKYGKTVKECGINFKINNWEDGLKGATKGCKNTCKKYANSLRRISGKKMTKLSMVGNY